MTNATLRTPAWLLRGLFGRTAGTLSLADGRLAFVTADLVTVFDVPIAALSVRSPWHLFGAGIVVTIGAARHRLSFVEPGENGDVRSGRAACRVWPERPAR